MKRGTKAILVILCAALLATASVLGSLAYLTDTDTAVNTFTVGNVGIYLDEAKVDPDGTVITGADRVDSNKYHLIPGQTYTKDPTVTVKAGSEGSYVRMLVTINQISALQAIFGADFLPQNYVTGWDNTVWIYETQTTGTDTITYEFRYHRTVDASDSSADISLEALFKTFTLPDQITAQELSTIVGLEIAVEAHAIQAAGFDSANAAWIAFDAQVNP